MKFSTREDIEVPQDAVFGAVSDFAGFERVALRNKVELTRLDDLAAAGPGMTWRIRFNWRGKKRSLEAVLREYDPPRAVRFTAESAGFRFEGGVTLVALSRKRTRLAVELDVRPKTMATRLMIQSMKLAKGSLSSRYEARVRAFAQRIEEDYRSTVA